MWFTAFWTSQPAQTPVLPVGWGTGRRGLPYKQLRVAGSVTGSHSDSADSASPLNLRPKSAGWQKSGRMSDGNREVTEALCWGLHASCQPAAKALLPLLSSSGSELGWVLLLTIVYFTLYKQTSWARPLNAPSFVLFLSLAPSFRTPRPLGARRQQGVLPSEGKGWVWVAIKHTKTSQTRSYLAWPAWVEASTLARLEKCCLPTQNAHAWGVWGTNVTGLGALCRLWQWGSAQRPGDAEKFGCACAKPNIWLSTFTHLSA